MGVGGQCHALAAAGWPHGWSGQVRNISPPPGFDPRTVQPVVSRYTDCVNPAHQISHMITGIRNFTLCGYHVIFFIFHKKSLHKFKTDKQPVLFLISNLRRVLNIVCILLGISPAFDCGLPTFRNPLSVPSSRAGCRV